MNNRDLAAAFRNGATAGTGSNMFIEGNVIYSYGHHFPIAFRRADGVFFYNNSRYSNSTSKQQSYVWRELPTNTVTVDTGDIKAIMDGKKLPSFKQYKCTRAAKSIIGVLSSAGFSPVNDWDQVKYGELPVIIQWSKWYGCKDSKAKVALAALITTPDGDKIGEVFAYDGKVKRGSDKLDIAAALFK